MDHGVGQSAAVRDAVREKSDYSKENYKTDFEIWMENTKFKFERKNIEGSGPPVDSTPVGAKTSDAKTVPTDSSVHNGKVKK